MSHEIDTLDEVVLRHNPAWHGLGHVIPNDMSPKQVIAAYNRMNFEVQRWTLTAHGPNGETLDVPTHVANVRRDIDPTILAELLGVVGSEYEIVQNSDLAEFTEALAVDGSGVVCESAGTIRNGKRVWFLCKSEAFEIGQSRGASNVVVPDLLVANSHDGTMAVRVQPTTVRVVCSNTLHMVVPRTDSAADVMSSCFAVRHTSSIHERIEEAKLALRQFSAARDATRGRMELLAQKPVSTLDVQRFFAESYAEAIGEIPETPTTAGERSARTRALSARDSFCKRFDEESADYGANAWVLMNAWTGLIQHDRKARGKDDADRVESRVQSNLFGLNAQRSSAAFDRALALTI